MNNGKILQTKLVIHRSVLTSEEVGGPHLHIILVITYPLQFIHT
jgi:hypothetical protein